MVLSLLLMASMTVTEVTTRIAIVGAVSLLGLVLVSGGTTRSRRTWVSISRSASFVAVTTTEVAQAHTHSMKRARTIGTRLVGLVATTLMTGTAIGVGLSLTVLVILNTLSLG